MASYEATPPIGHQSDTPAGHGRSDEQIVNDNDVRVTQAPGKSNPGEPLSPSGSWRLTPDEASKVAQVLQACNDNDTQQLIALAATRGGFVEDHIRRLACM